MLVNHPIEQANHIPAITVNPSRIASAEWNLVTGQLDISPQSEGDAEITLVFPAVGNYTAASVTFYIYVVK